MDKTFFYLDTCIWLNLFKKEGDSKKGKPYWEIAKDFIEMVMLSENKEIYYSGLILKELKFNMDLKIFNEKLLFLKKDFIFVKVNSDDYVLARKLESEFKYSISFYDCLHITICKRMNLILVTRDNELMRYAKSYITTKRPEELIN